MHETTCSFSLSISTFGFVGDKGFVFERSSDGIDDCQGKLAQNEKHSIENNSEETKNKTK